MLYRLFPYRPDARLVEPGGALFVPRIYQGRSRHDNPNAYGALYASRSGISAVAEHLQAFKDVPLTEERLRGEEGVPYALAAIDDTGLRGLVDLDDPSELARRELRPSGVATRTRDRTQPLALSLFREGVSGFEWWSTLEASWINVTLFAERASGHLRLLAEPEPLTLDHPDVIAATLLLDIRPRTRTPRPGPSRG